MTGLADDETFARAVVFLYAFTGIILPLIAFGCAAPRGNWATDEPWQTSDFWVYATLVLRWPAVWPFYPLLLASMTAMALFLWDRRRFSQWLPVRIGLYGGVPLAAQFCWLVYAPTDQAVEAVVKTVIIVLIVLGVGHLALLLIAVVGVSLFQWLKHDWGWRGLVIASAIAAGAILVTAFTAGGELGLPRILAVPLFLIWVSALAASPAFALAAYFWASMSAATARQETRAGWSIKSILGLTTWFACQLGAWRQAMNLAIAEYATLPVEDTSCFVCTAAAQGHRSFVGSEAVRRSDGGIVWVTRQLRIFKAAELALMAIAPAAHQRLRRLYNALGPWIATRITHPLAADAAYAALKPLEWIARAVLLLCGIGPTEIAAIYSAHADRSRD
jgi:hypothetical protein